MEISVVVYRPQRLMRTQPGVLGHSTGGCWPSHWVAPADPELAGLRYTFAQRIWRAR